MSLRINSSRSKVLSAIVTSLAVFVLSGSTTFACTYGILGAGNCQPDGSFKITWTVNNTDTAVNQPLTVADSSNPSVIPNGTVIPADQSATFTQVVSGTTPASYNLSLVGNWPSHQLNETQKGTVQLAQACTQPAAPVYSCDNLTINSEPNRTVALTGLNTTAKNGAVFANTTIDWGDRTPSLTTNNVNGQTHQYATDGTYTIAATAQFNVNGQTVSATSQSCTQVVTITTPSTPTPTLPTPTTLVNTGPGNVIGIATAISLAGTVGYNLYLRRKLNKN